MNGFSKSPEYSGHYVSPYSSSSSDYDYDYKDHSPVLMKKPRREVLEEYSEPNPYPDYTSAAPAGKTKRKSLHETITQPYFWEDFRFNFVHYVLVPASAVFLFGLCVYAEVARSTGY